MFEGYSCGFVIRMNICEFVGGKVWILGWRE